MNKEQLKEWVEENNIKAVSIEKNKSDGVKWNIGEN